MRERLILGPFLIAGLVGIFWLDAWSGSLGLPPGVVLLAVGLIVCVAIAREMSAMGFAKNGRSTPIIAMLAAAMGISSMWLSGLDHALAQGWSAMVVPTAAITVLFVALWQQSRHRSCDGALATAGSTLLIFAYPGLAMGCFLAIRHEHSAWILLWIFITTKSSDIGAYFTGKSIGKHKLIPWLSPGKTWEGLFGGIALAAAIGGLGAWLLGASLDEQTPPPWLGAVLGAIIALLGQLGDLAASMFKRDAGVKDSGARIPGFGGLLDLADSTLIVGVAAYWTLLLSH